MEPAAPATPLHDTPCVITGGSRGIGAATAIHLGSLGAPMVIVCRTDTESAHEVAAAIEAQGTPALVVQADVRRPEDVSRVFDLSEEAFGPVGLLVNNAAIHRGGTVQRLRLEDWNAVLETGLTGAFLCCARAVPGMLTRGAGRIVNVSSAVGLNGFPGDAAYTSVKAGLLGLTRALALELAPHGIPVNAVAPGFVDTDMTRQLRPDVLKEAVAGIPVGRQATVDEIATSIGFLATAPAYVTGHTLVVDGGWTLG